MLDLTSYNFHSVVVKCVGKTFGNAQVTVCDGCMRLDHRTHKSLVLKSASSATGTMLTPYADAVNKCLAKTG